MAYIRLNEASEMLGIDTASLCVAQKYKPFYKSRKDNMGGAFFDVSAYLNFEETQFSILEKTKLFVEYLVHEEKYTYSFIATKGQLQVQALHHHSFSVKKAINIAKWFAHYRPFTIQRFDEYYGWPHKKSLRQIAFVKSGSAA